VFPIQEVNMTSTSRRVGWQWIALGVALGAAACEGEAAQDSAGEPVAASSVQAERTFHPGAELGQRQRDQAPVSPAAASRSTDETAFEIDVFANNRKPPIIRQINIGQRAALPGPSKSAQGDR
jgi:hypothetical protein